MTAIQPGTVRSTRPLQRAPGSRLSTSTGTGLLIAVLLLAVSGLGGCNRGDQGEANAQTEGNGGAADRVGKVTNVHVQVMQPTTFSSTIHVTGVVEAINDAVVSAEEGGVLRRFLAPRGSLVKAGQPLAQLDDSLLRTQVREAEAMSALAGETYERRHRLWTEDKVGSELTYLQARHEADRLRAALDGLRTRLARTTIKAPFDGIFDDEYLEVGESAAPGTPIARVIGIDQLKVTGGVPERFARDVTPRNQGQITFDMLPGVVLECPVHFVGSSVEQASRTFTVELRIDDPPPFIKPAMIANIDLIREELRDVLVVPQNAVSRTEDGFRVFVATGEAGDVQAISRLVALGPSSANRVVIEQGLEPGDRVIILGQVDDGSWVRIVDTPTDAGTPEETAESTTAGEQS